ncbi:MAG: type III polyketide synthase [Microvirga sp.]
MSPSPRLIALATATPEHVLLQRDVAAAARAMFAGRYEGFDRMARIFATTGIEKRHSVRPLEWFATDHGWPERTRAYLEGALGLFRAAASEALDRAALTASDIDTIVTASSTGIATPSLDARLLRPMGFRDGVRRVPIFGLGCAGGVSGLAVAADLARARPGSNVLFVAVELCTLAFRLDVLTKANLVATALFGDGAAAIILRSGDSGGGVAVEAAGQHTWPATLDVMGWSVDPGGFGVVLARTIPPFIEAHLAPAIAGILGRAGLTLGDIDRFLCHPGGRKVITALERSLALDQGSLDHERAVLSACGNMSAPTVLFVLERALQAGLPHRSLLSALGPGFSASCVVLERIA